MGKRALMNRARRRALAALSGAAAWSALRGSALAAASADAEKAWPARAMRIVASVAAGSSLDTLARLTATHLEAGLGQNVVVENRAGASGNVAAEAVARAAPDGTTFLFTSNSITTLPALIGARAGCRWIDCGSCHRRSISRPGCAASRRSLVAAHFPFD